MKYLPKWFRSIIKYINKIRGTIWERSLALYLAVCTPLLFVEAIAHINEIEHIKDFVLRSFFAGLIIVPGILSFLEFFVMNIFIDRVLYEDRLEQNYSNGTSVIPFSLFEGAYVRNPEAWTLAEDHVERVSDEHYQGKGYWFTWPDYKRYVKFCKRIKKQKEEHEKQQELSLVHSEIKRFEADPILYIKNGKEPLKLEYVKPQKEYDQLQKRIAEKRRQLALEEISNDYLKE